MSERFLVSIEVEVDGAHGGWQPQPILDAAKDCLTGDSQHTFRHLTIERVTKLEGRA